MLEYICKYFFLPLLTTLLFTINLSILLKIKKIKKSFILLSTIIFINFEFLYNYDYLFFILSSILLFIYFIFIEKVPFIEFISAFLNMLFVSLLSDALCGIGFAKMSTYSSDVIRNSADLFTLSNLFVVILSIILSSILVKLLSRFDFSFKLTYKNKYIKKLLYLTILLLLLIIYLYRYIAFTFLENLPAAYITGSIAILLFTGIIYYYINQTINLSLKKDFIDKENKQLKDYTQMLESMSSDLRKFKHDYVNILYTLGDFINNGDIEGLKKYYDNDLLPESKKIVRTDKNITLLRNIKITPIKALISSKLLSAQSEGIEINAEVLEEITSLSIKTIDICRILGIFLDNAAEATILCAKKFIHFAMIKTEDDVIIVIINSCPENVPPVYKLYEKNFSTKGNNRGIGLSNVNDLISSNYNNILLNTSCNKGIFKQELIIKNCILK